MTKQCLIAEHDPWDIQLLRLCAERLGFQIAHVYAAQDVLPVAQQTHPDVIVLDANLPGSVACHEVICALKSDPSTWPSAVVVFSEALELSPEMEGPGIGGSVACLPKPATLVGFRQALERAGVMAPDQGPDRGQGPDVGQRPSLGQGLDTV